MSITHLAIQEFTAFEQVDFEFSAGINVLIGANSTGKTHVMKLLYSLLKVCKTAHRDKLNDRNTIENRLQQKLAGVFKPDHVGRLVRRGRGSGQVSFTYNDRKIAFSLTTNKHLSLDYARLPQPASSLYIPAHEFLSIYEGFISAYTQRETSFDETYYDLSLALNALPLRGPRLAEIKPLIDPLEKAIRGKVSQENGKFYVKFREGKLEAQLVSEGVRKIAGLIYLLNNGALTKNGILFWDEPEANLNPKMVTIVAKMLQLLANSGVQIFIATHDYLLSQELSLLSEYGADTLVKFFALHRPKQQAGVEVESGHSLIDIQNNPILEELVAHYDREVALFQK